MAVGCWIIWANARLAVWRESLLRGEEAPGRSDAHTRIGATLGPAGTPSGADAGMGTKGRGLGAVLGLPVLAPVQAAALRGQSAAEIRAAARDRTDAPDPGTGCSPPRCPSASTPSSAPTSHARSRASG
ncbi:hypothetical protein [Nonomuraea sp. NPDC049309]|uniref:hypothetical protein n=1 Tax=Nonomuraea sp. NPDC049309 TaxID=3364350 RepID=UPI003716810A